MWGEGLSVISLNGGWLSDLSLNGGGGLSDFSQWGGDNRVYVCHNTYMYNIHFNHTHMYLYVCIYIFIYIYMMLVHEDARGSGVGSHLEGVEPHSCHMISPGTIYSYIYI